MSDVWRPDWSEDQLFTALRPAAAGFALATAWPSLDDYNAAAAALALKNSAGMPLRFVVAPPKPRGRARRQAAQRRYLPYEDRIYELGEIPSRRDNWHDFFNMLVWLTFPLSKAALNLRQVAARSPDGRRSREQDRLAMFDEGGIIELRAAARDERVPTVIFGHALYEAHIRQHSPIYGMTYSSQQADPFTNLSFYVKLKELDKELAQAVATGQFGNAQERPSRLLLSELVLRV